MLASIEDLLVLQDRDRRLLDLQKRLEGLPNEESRARSRLTHDENAVTEAKATLQRNGVETKNLELDIETRRTTIGRLKVQQFETRKNEEFRALGHEIERYTAEIDDLETRQLDLMEKADALRATLEDAGQSLAKSQRVVEEDLVTIDTRRRNLESDVQETLGLRAEAAAKVESQLLNLYERLMKKKKGLAVVPVENGQCGGCHVKLIPATLVRVQSATDVTQCENCGRILYPGE